MSIMCNMCGYFNEDSDTECRNCQSVIGSGTTKRFVLGITGYSRLTNEEMAVVMKIIGELVIKYAPYEVTCGGGFGVDKAVGVECSKRNIRWSNNFPSGIRYDQIIERNMRFAGRVDRLVVITKKLDNKPCEYCKEKNHEKCGGCWTLKYAKEHGKDTEMIII